MRYVCDACREPVQRSGSGLGTWHCRKHPSRTVTVLKDLSAGKEGSARSLVETPVSVKRHTRVRAVK